MMLIEQLPSEIKLSPIDGLHQGHESHEGYSDRAIIYIGMLTRFMLFLWQLNSVRDYIDYDLHWN